jgi:hypothetical protein
MCKGLNAYRHIGGSQGERVKIFGVQAPTLRALCEYKETATAEYACEPPQKL